MSFTLESEPTIFDWPANINTRSVLSSSFFRPSNGMPRTSEKKSVMNVEFLCFISCIENYECLVSRTSSFMPPSRSAVNVIMVVTSFTSANKNTLFDPTLLLIYCSWRRYNRNRVTSKSCVTGITHPVAKPVSRDTRDRMRNPGNGVLLFSGGY